VKPLDIEGLVVRIVDTQMNLFQASMSKIEVLLKSIDDHIQVRLTKIDSDIEALQSDVKTLQDDTKTLDEKVSNLETEMINKVGLTATLLVSAVEIDAVPSEISGELFFAPSALADGVKAAHQQTDITFPVSTFGVARSTTSRSVSPRGRKRRRSPTTSDRTVHALNRQRGKLVSSLSRLFEQPGA